METQTHKQVTSLESQTKLAQNGLWWYLQLNFLVKVDEHYSHQISQVFFQLF